MRLITISALSLLVFITFGITPPAIAQRESAKVDSSVQFEGGRKAVEISYEASLGLIFVPLKVNDSRELWFILDTGFDVTIIDAALAKDLKLNLENTKTIQQPGGEVEIGDISGVDLNLDGLKIKGQNLQAAPIAPLGKFIGREFTGIIGHDVIEKFALEIDYEKHVLTFHEPKTYRYPGHGKSVTVDVIAGEPFVVSEVIAEGRAPIKAKMKIDTGSIDGLGFNKNFIEAHKLPGQGRETIDVPGIAVGGDTKGIAFKLKGFRIAGYLLSDLVAGATIDSGGFENRDDAGTFGADILDRFNIVLDYTRKRIIFDPHKDFDRPFTPDKAGVLFAAEGGNFKKFKIHSLIANSPAADAGLKSGDEIVSIDGLAQGELTLDLLSKMMRAKEGRIYKMKIGRDGKLLDIDLKLRSLFAGNK